MLSEQDRWNELDRKCIKCMDIYLGLDLHYAGLATKVLKPLSARSGRDTEELCPFDAFVKCRWMYRGENIPCNESVMSP